MSEAGLMPARGGRGILMTMSGAIAQNPNSTTSPGLTKSHDVSSMAGAPVGPCPRATIPSSHAESAERHSIDTSSAANKAGAGRRRKSSVSVRRRRASRMGNFGYTGLLGNLAPEKLPNLLEQPRSRLIIEDSKQLQEGTEMGIYMQQSSQCEQTSLVVNARAPVGQLRLGSFARRVALTAFGIWEHAVSHAKHQAFDRKRRFSALHVPAFVESESGSSHPSAHPSCCNSRTASKDTFHQPSHNSADAFDELAEAEPNGTVSAGAGNVQDTRRVGALMRQLFQRSMRETNEFGMAVSSEAPAPHGMLCQQVDAAGLTASSSSFCFVDTKKGAKNRLANRNSPDQSPRATWSWGFSEGARSGRGRERSMQLLDDQSYVDEEMSKLRKGKVMLKDALSTIDSAELFENHCLYTPYAQQIRRKKESMMAKESGETGSVSLPSLHPRGRQTAISNSLKPVGCGTGGSFYGDASEEKGKKKGSASPTSSATQVRELQLLMHKSTHNLTQPAQAKAAAKKRHTTEPRMLGTADETTRKRVTRS
eukprot:TRINITY_DN2897_c0_g1_i1.p1 TRINITY_DN2897_c0_g1~~TRINITY_DN2897_c0_g1_i1.p1  ORF type:complete len:537 (+),score=71.52 TRINITY_DN2897_c0_g1_i1:50-1660(+)